MGTSLKDTLAFCYNGAGEATDASLNVLMCGARNFLD